jgi:hypothetical protein
MILIKKSFVYMFLMLLPLNSLIIYYERLTINVTMADKLVNYMTIRH